MHDFPGVQGVKTGNHLKESMPDLCLLHEVVCLLELIDLRLEIATVAELHDDAESTSFFLEKCFFVASHILVLH